MIRAPLEVGAEVWMLLHDVIGKQSASGDRSVLAGAARARVVEVGDPYRVELLAVSGSARVGSVRDAKRVQLYAVADRAEHAAFGVQVNRFWGQGDALLAAHGDEIEDAP